ncbi:MAG: hypothetical protein IT440_10480 [Phycisphaeraceae bacterium]|nr:hypothetical protein [Phycisphaeraceae bacterium]
MNHVERFKAVMHFQPVDRLPVWEWAMWWDKTIERWRGEGLPRDFKFSEVFAIAEHLELDPYQQFWLSTTTSSIDATQHHTEGVVSNMDDYLRIRPHLFPDHSRQLEVMKPWMNRQARGDVVVWTTLEGFFWFPRTLMDVERLSYAYYDEPELIHAINRDLLAFNLRLVEQLRQARCLPTFTTVAEDMSYNHGPMISRQIFADFLAPYYRPLIAALRELDVLTFVDTDGDVERMIPWLLDAGVAGVLPLERQAGVDGNALRLKFPRLGMVGHFDKMTMTRGESAMRTEFERLLPLMRGGGYIPSVDHQTPPGVSLDQYRAYLRLLREYAGKV